MKKIKLSLLILILILAVGIIFPITTNALDFYAGDYQPNLINSSDTKSMEEELQLRYKW